MEWRFYNVCLIIRYIYVDFHSISLPDSNVNAESHIRMEAICKHKKAKDDHIIGSNNIVDVLRTISKPNTGVIEVGLSRPGREKAAGLIRYTIEVVKSHKLRRGTHYQPSLSWRTLHSAEIIRKVVFDDDIDDLVPPQWACIISSLDGLVKNTQDLAEVRPIFRSCGPDDVDDVRSSSIRRLRLLLVQSVQQSKYAVVLVENWHINSNSQNES